MQQRKIIHIDMDCFYAAIEMRDNPNLRDKPLAVGGDANRRGVLCTCNYVARRYGVHSAMASAHALRICPELIIVPPNMAKYKHVSNGIRQIFAEFTDLIEPLSLDEAFLDVSASRECKGSATLIAKTIRERIYQQHKLTASAGVASNKFLAKVASDWHKPNGQLVLPPAVVDDFILALPVKKIFGVGKVTNQRLADLGIKTCADLQDLSLLELTKMFGKFGARFYELSRGIDKRPVNPDRQRKSMSVERTFDSDLASPAECLLQLDDLYEELRERLHNYADVPIRKQFVKIKFHDFQQTTVENTVSKINLNTFKNLLSTGYARQQKPVRLLGLGVGFAADLLYQQLPIPYLD